MWLKSANWNLGLGETETLKDPFHKYTSALRLSAINLFQVHKTSSPLALVTNSDYLLKLIGFGTFKKFGA